MTDCPLIRIAIPKGRVFRAISQAVASNSLLVTRFASESEDRSLLRDVPELGWKILLLKPDDVPTYVEFGAADFGVCGRDVLIERGFDLLQLVDLQLGRCSMVLAAKSSQTELPKNPRIATKYPRIAASYFAKKGINAEIIYVQGSVELAPITGLSDVIVDIVETGETLRQNGLSVLEHVTDISSVLVANRATYKLLGTRAREAVSKFCELLHFEAR